MASQRNVERARQFVIKILNEDFTIRDLTNLLQEVEDEERTRSAEIARNCLRWGDDTGNVIAREIMKGSEK